MENNMEHQLGTGAIPDLPDKRDYKYEFVASASSPINWSVGFRLPEPPDHNQNSSDSCVAHSSSYLHWQHKGKDYSRRDLFSRIALDYGAYLRDGVKQTTTTGQQTKDECPDPDPQTPANMRVKSSLPDSAGMDDLEASYFSVPADIDYIAQAIRDHKGCIFGVVGNWATWGNLTYPEPPSPNTNNWGHAVYAMGYHMDGGQKCIIAKSSWCDGNHKEHHFKENYFKAGMVYSPWAIVPKGEYMEKKYLVINDGGKIYLALLQGFGGTLVAAKSMEALEDLKSALEVPADAPVYNYPN